MESNRINKGAGFLQGLRRVGRFFFLMETFQWVGIDSQILGSRSWVKFSMERIWHLLTKYGQRVIRKYNINIASMALTYDHNPILQRRKVARQTFK